MFIEMLKVSCHLIISALIINATCVLHNIAKHYNIPDVAMYRDNIEAEDIDGNNDVPANMRQRGNMVRESIIEKYFT